MEKYLNDKRIGNTWSVIPIADLPDTSPVIGIMDYRNKSFAEFHLVEYCIVPKNVIVNLPVIAHIFNGRAEYGISKEESEANAALICEAKNMYYALKEILEPLEGKEIYSPTFQRAKAILSRINNK